jgi:hypothetical protein
MMAAQIAGHLIGRASVWPGPGIVLQKEIAETAIAVVDKLMEIDRRQHLGGQ